MQKVIIAVDSFKDSLDAVAVCAAIHRGISAVSPQPQVVSLPLGDGGEGTARLLTALHQAEWISTTVEDPLGRNITAGYGWDAASRTAYLDMAQASGLQHLAPEERNPLRSSTYGFGQLLRHAFRQNPRRIIIGIGGSATSEGGTGMAAALGYRFIDRAGKPLEPNGASLNHIARILPPEESPLPEQCQIAVLCDVQNPLYGPRGAAFVFGRQKGATLRQITELDRGLQRLAAVIQRDLQVDVHQLPGGGAAGGLGAGLLAFTGGRLLPGIDTILDSIDFEEQIRGADFIITGEGRLDAQTGGGKLIQGICRKAARQQIPVIALCGSLEASPTEIQQMGLQAAFSILNGPVSLASALAQTEKRLEETTWQLCRVLNLTKL